MPSAQAWRTANQLFETLLNVPENRRRATIDSLEVTTEVKEALRLLLTSLDKTSILDGDLENVVAIESTADQQITGQVFGDWKVGKEIGRGGMSVVYEATRSGERFEHKAAFKRLSIAFLSKSHVESFHRECAALATLSHPGIARLIHSGVADDGTPWLVIELIDGRPIDQHCSGHALGSRAIVELIVKLCDAVEHAHRHLIVHRDINPANVFVDSRGDPKLLDFGVAKMLGDADPEQKLRAYTPGHAAPEQIEDRAITTATDVYALGRLLDRLLAGQIIDRDLQAIIGKATKQQPECRYDSARNLGDDLQAWQDLRPVSAIDNTVAYRLAKYSRRHWGLLSLVGVLVIAIVAGVGGTVWHARAAKLQAAKHRSVADFMLEMFQQADLMQSGADLRVTELLEAAAKSAPKALADQPEALVSLYNLIASGQIELTNYGGAAAVLANAEMLIEEGNISVPTIASYHVQRGREAYELGRFGLAVEHLRSAVSLLANGADEALYFEAGANLVSYLVDSEDFAAALELAEDLMSKMNAAALSPVSRGMVIHRYAVALEVNGKVDDAFEYYHQALDIQSNDDPDNLLGRASILNDLGIAHYFAGQMVEAELAYREALAIFAKQFEAPHPRISSTIHNIAFAIVEQNRLDEAIELLQEAYEMSIELHGPEHIDSLIEQSTLANLMGRAGQYDEAEAMLRQNLESLANLASDRVVQRGTVHSYLGDLLMQTDRLQESRIQYLHAQVLFSELPADHVRVVEVKHRLEEIDEKLIAVGTNDEL